MQRLELDYLKTGPRDGWASYLLLALALTLVVCLALFYRRVADEIVLKEARLATGAPRTSDAGTELTRPADPQEFGYARSTILRLSTPWDRLFAALEAAHSDRVALLAVEPDVDAGTVNLSAEAKDYLAVLTYVANLENQQTLRKAHLTRHEVKQNDPQRPIAFAVSASWKEVR